MNANVSEDLYALGGRLVKDKDGEYWRFSSNGFNLELEPFQSGEVWGFDCSLEHREFSKLVNFISGEKPGNFVSIKWFQRIESKTNLTAYEIIRDILQSASAEPINDYVTKFAEYLPEKSVPQLCHLAALAWRKDFDRLLDYQNNFKRGNRSGFVPMIDEKMIERAVNKALEN